MHTEIDGEHGYGIKAFIADRKIAFSDTGGKIRILLKIAYFPTCFLHLIRLKIYLGVNMTARDALTLVWALQRILPVLLIPTAPVMVKPELTGINESRSVNTPF